MSASALFAAPLDVSLHAYKVIRNDAGAEELVGADVAEPGDVIEYQATYSNASSVVLKAVAPEIPVPAGLTYVPGSDQPKAAQGSLDGSHFSALPIKDSEGKPLPESRMRSIRWSTNDLPPSESVTVRLRAVVNR